MRTLLGRTKLMNKINVFTGRLEAECRAAKKVPKKVADRVPQ
jgi:hypothetical protein